MELEKVFNNDREEKLYQSIATAVSNYYDGQLLECDIDCIAAGIVERLILENGKYESEDKKFETYAILYRIHGIMHREEVHAYSEANARTQFEEIHRHGSYKIELCCPARELSNKD